MKKTLFVLSMLLISGIFLISCKKDSTTTSSASLVGTWEPATSHTVEIDSLGGNTTPNITDSTYTHGHAGTITFNSNGTYSVSDPFDTPPSTEAGTYTAANGKITTIPTSSTGNGGITLFGATYSISGNKLTVIATESVTGLFSSTSTLVLNRQ